MQEVIDMKTIDLTKNEDAVKLIAFALDTRQILIGMKNDYIQEIQFLKELD